MDARQCMIVDWEQRGNRRMFITEQVASIQQDEKGYWRVRFLKSSRVFNYNKTRLLYLTQPEIINLEDRGLYINNQRINNLSEVRCFSCDKDRFFHVTYTNGYTECFEGKNVYLTRTPLHKIGNSTWDFLLHLADETGLCAQEGYNVLAKGYSLVDVCRDNVPLSQYLGSPNQLKTYSLPAQVIFPFGCNASQKEAVEAALTHQLSIIQGPPGTGKTQTILNIIANLLLENKHILVVSNNNSAVKNVEEKLEKEGLGFIVAPLGNAQNKEKFIHQQQPNYPPMEGWVIEEQGATLQLAKQALQVVSQCFEEQTQLAKLKAAYQALKEEQHYHELQDNTAILEREWLCHKSSKKLIQLLTACQFRMEKSQRFHLWFRLKWSFILGRRAMRFLKSDISHVIKSLQHAYYYTRKLEIEQAMHQIKARLNEIDLPYYEKKLASASLQVLKNKIARRYTDESRKLFAYHEIKSETKAFLEEYPIVLSSTYLSNSNINTDFVFDYVIMDEASQVDIKTGALALSCATNAVIVGDDKQLPHVVNQEEKLAIHAIQSHYAIPKAYNVITHSFLQSCSEVFQDAPTTLLREHYRCHPKIIEFCNQRFYEGKLITMTKDLGESKVLQVIRTVKGNHARQRYNQREIDVILQEVLPHCASQGSVGIITPYRDQAQAINEILGQEIASTVHKYQGRECDTIIMSMVDNTPTEFSDDAHLLNVAISRAKRQLCIVTTGNELPAHTNLAQLIGYIQYHNFEVRDSKLHSVFDLLYQQYTAERLSYQAQHPTISEYLSENLVYHTLQQALQELQKHQLAVVCHYPLTKLIADWSLLNEQECCYAASPFTHVDFLIYNNMTKQPLMAIEVDGWHFHKNNRVQQFRDRMKDSVLAKCRLTLHRISTTDMVTSATLKPLLATIPV